MGGGRAEPPAAMGARGKLQLHSRLDGMHAGILASSQLEGSYLADALQGV